MALGDFFITTAEPDAQAGPKKKKAKKQKQPVEDTLKPPAPVLRCEAPL